MNDGYSYGGNYLGRKFTPTSNTWQYVAPLPFLPTPAFGGYTGEYAFSKTGTIYKYAGDGPATELLTAVIPGGNYPSFVKLSGTGMCWENDGETELKPNSVRPSVSPVEGSCETCVKANWYQYVHLIVEAAGGARTTVRIPKNWQYWVTSPNIEINGIHYTLVNTASIDSPYDDTVTAASLKHFYYYNVHTRDSEGNQSAPFPAKIPYGMGAFSGGNYILNGGVKYYSSGTIPAGSGGIELPIFVTLVDQYGNVYGEDPGWRGF
jgi:hypothetical protein